MSSQVRVEDLEVFRMFRAALLKFAQSASLSLANAESDIARVHGWLENEQSSFWQGQWRKRTEAVAKARDAVRQKKLYKDMSGSTRTAIEEEKYLAKCVAAVAEAEEKILAIKKALPRLEKAADMYRGGVSGMNRSLSSDIPNAVSLLDKLAAILEGYVQIEGPAIEMPDLVPTPMEPSFARPADAEPKDVPPDPPKPATQPPAPVTTADQPREERHVADGQ